MGKQPQKHHITIINYDPVTSVVTYKPINEIINGGDVVLMTTPKKEDERLFQKLGNRNFNRNIFLGSKGRAKSLLTE